MQRRPVWPHAALALYVLTALASVTWPVLDLVTRERIDARVLGLPFCMVGVAGWALASFAALGLYMLVTEREDDA
jgi:hypothetical protein